MTLQHTNRRDSLKTLAALGAAASAPLAFAQKPLTVGVIYVGPRDDFGYNQAQAQAAAEAAWDLARQRYQAGLGTYLQVLGAETAVLAQRRQQLDLAAQALGAQIGLTQAMGGGWQPSATVSSPGTTTVSVAPH